jgi:hypothetical protein
MSFDVTAKRLNGLQSLSAASYCDYPTVFNIHISDNPCWIVAIKYYLLSGAGGSLRGVH